MKTFILLFMCMAITGHVLTKQCGPDYCTPPWPCPNMPKDYCKTTVHGEYLPPNATECRCCSQCSTSM